MADERTSPRLATIAANLLAMTDAEIVAYALTHPARIRAIAGTALTQTRDHSKPPAQPHGDGDIVFAEDDGLSTEPTVTEQLNAAGTPPIEG